MGTADGFCRCSPGLVLDPVPCVRSQLPRLHSFPSFGAIRFSSITCFQKPSKTIQKPALRCFKKVSKRCWPELALRWPYSPNPGPRQPRQVAIRSSRLSWTCRIGPGSLTDCQPAESSKRWPQTESAPVWLGLSPVRTTSISADSRPFRMSLSPRCRRGRVVTMASKPMS